jgi:hypothetical protein
MAPPSWPRTWAKFLEFVKVYPLPKLRIVASIWMRPMVRESQGTTAESPLQRARATQQPLWLRVGARYKPSDARSGMTQNSTLPTEDRSSSDAAAKEQ